MESIGKQIENYRKVNAGKNKGRKHSEESKQKMREAKKNIRVSNFINEKHGNKTKPTRYRNRPKLSRDTIMS
ncbi:MAG: hypothetical protein HC831_13440, partial [Chloroflexia bacterium]|nr:hypothetical protein [Chloroflexia bacterium]